MAKRLDPEVWIFGGENKIPVSRESYRECGRKALKKTPKPKPQ